MKPKNTVKNGFSKENRKKNKLFLIDLLGGKCFRCGFEGNELSFDFHHVFKHEKSISVGIFNGKKEEFIKEVIVPEIVGKCVLLCKNCHAVVTHDGYENAKIMILWFKEKPGRRSKNSRVIELSRLLEKIEIEERGI